jgi:V8-like Glu-specific endopeptidase
MVSIEKFSPTAAVIHAVASNLVVKKYFLTTAHCVLSSIRRLKSRATC